MKRRFGFDSPKNRPIEESIRWAAENGFGYIDFQADVPPNNIASFDAARVRTVRELCETHDIAIGIHPSSAINNAEYTPIMSEAVDDYLFANLELAQQLGCGWLIGHGGYHFGDVAQRRDAAIKRIQRLVARAEEAEIVIFLKTTIENQSMPKSTTFHITWRKHAGFSTQCPRPTSNGHLT